MGRLLVLGVFLLVGSGCAVRQVDSLRFRTLQRETAYERALAAVELHCNGVLKEDRERGVIYSNWIDPDFGWGIPPRYLWYRYVITVVDNRADESADVRLTMQPVFCGILDSRDPERMAKECGPPEHIPGEVRDNFERVKLEFQRDVFRRDG